MREPSVNPACVDTLHMYPGACTDRVCAWYVTLTGIDVVHDEADVTGLARRRERAKDCGSVLFFVFREELVASALRRDGVRIWGNRQEGPLLRRVDGLQRMHVALHHARRLYFSSRRLL